MTCPPRVAHFRAMGILSGWALTASTPPPAPPVTPDVSATMSVASPWADNSELFTADLAAMFGVDADCLPVTRRQAIALPAVARGRDLICISVARLALWGMDGNGRLAVQPRILQRPEIGRSRFMTYVWTVDDMLFHGFGTWLVVQRYAEDGRPITARYVPRSKVETDPDTGEIVKCFGQTVGPFDVIRFDAPHEGILTRAAASIRAARLIHDTYGRAAGTPNPTVDLHQTDGDVLDDVEIDKLVARWRNARRGPNGLVAFTSKGITANFPNAQQPEALLIAARQAADLDLARHMGLAAWAVDAQTGGTNLTYSSTPMRSRELIDFTLAGYMEAITSRLSLDDVLPAGRFAAFSTDVLTDGNFGERMKAAKDAKDAGVFTDDELRAREAANAVEGVRP